MKDSPDCDGNCLSPVPIPPITLTGTSELPTIAPVSKFVGPLEGATVEIGAMDGMKIQEKPSWLMSNSIKGGSSIKLVEESRGVAMLIIDLIRDRAMARSV